MTFYDRYQDLCLEVGMKSRSKEMLEIAGVSSPSVNGTVMYHTTVHPFKRGSKVNST